MRVLTRLLILVLLCAAVSMADTGEWFFSFAVTARTQLATLTPLISIDAVRGTTVVAYATAAQFARFQSLAIPYTILPHPSTLVTPRMSDDPRAVQARGAWDVYPTYGAYTSMMYGFAHDYPALCRITNVGNSVQGRQLLCAILSDNVWTREDEPQVLYSAAMHGNETTGFILLSRLIDYLLTMPAASRARRTSLPMSNCGLIRWPIPTALIMAATAPSAARGATMPTAWTSIAIFLIPKSVCIPTATPGSRKPWR